MSSRSYPAIRVRIFAARQKIRIFVLFGLLALVKSFSQRVCDQRFRHLAYSDIRTKTIFNYFTNLH